MPLSYDTLRTARDGAVLTLTMDRPAKRNALSPPLDEDLRAVFSDGEATDSDVRAVVLTGAGEGFCSGADLSAFEDLPDPDAVEAYLKEHYLPLIEALTTLEKPVIAAVNGAAAGAGAALALACDLRVMAEEAALVVAFSSIGLVPDMGTTWLLARHVGYGRAYELCATGEAVEAMRCEAMGLANRVVPPRRTDRPGRRMGHRAGHAPHPRLGPHQEGALLRDEPFPLRIHRARGGAPARSQRHARPPRGRRGVSPEARAAVRRMVDWWTADR
jgi:2-(1,2-epoxy-1,2-dihydrophenyl)acetyl-CoA isomerase